jgi:hypothetical protein
MNDRAIPRRLFSRLKSGRHQARGVGGVRILNELPQEAIPGIADGGLVANGVDDKSSAIMVSRQETPIPLCGMGEFRASLKTPEKVAIRMGRCCLFSIICGRF